MSYPPSSDFAGKAVPDFAVGSMTAARFWSMDKHGRLVGHYGQLWTPGENVAECPSDCAGVEATCTCGFYGYHDIDQVLTYGDDFLPGVIEAYGIVLVGEKGLRCSKARIIGIRPRTAFQRAALARYYPDAPAASASRLRKLMRYDWLPEPDGDFWTRDAQPLHAPEHYRMPGNGMTFYWHTSGNPVAVTNSSGVIGYSGTRLSPSHNQPVIPSKFRDAWARWNAADNEDDES